MAPGPKSTVFWPLFGPFWSLFGVLNLFGGPSEKLNTIWGFLEGPGHPWEQLGDPFSTPFWPLLGGPWLP